MLSQVSIDSVLIRIAWGLNLDNVASRIILLSTGSADTSEPNLEAVIPTLGVLIRRVVDVVRG
jgi:hypothetical protein